MKRLSTISAALLLAATAWAAQPQVPRLLEKANVLPLALDDAYQFRKTKIFFNDPQVRKQSMTEQGMIEFEQLRVNFGAVTNNDRRERYGHYFTFFWRAQKTADLTVRLEYRQSKLGSQVQARELSYPAAKGSFRSEFDIIGDDYFEDGTVTAWRVLLIENGKIVALNQSFLWN